MILQAERASVWSALAFLLGYYSTIVGSNVGLALAVNRWLVLLSDRAYRALLLLCSAIMAVYGLLLLGRGLPDARRGLGPGRSNRGTRGARSGLSASDRLGGRR